MVIRMTIDCETIKQAISCEKGLSLLALELSSKKCNAQIER